MKIDQNPFSIYDFLGYLIPGFFFLWLTEFVIKTDLNNPVFTLNITYKLDDYFIIIVLSYIVGHILSYLSSITVELYSLWTLGYPSRYLMEYEYPGFWRKVLYDRSVIIITIKILMVISIFPVLIFDLMIRLVLNIPKLLGKPMDKNTIEIVKDRISEYKKENTNSSIVDNQGDFFSEIYHKDLAMCGIHVTKMQNYVALYGFTRTICYSLTLINWIILIKGFGGSFSMNTSYIIVFITILSGIMYLDFNKFYRKFSLEALMAFISIEKKT